MTEEHPLMDTDLLAELAAELGDDGLAEVLSSFRRELERQITVLECALDADSSDQIGPLAHRLCSSAGLFGATRLSRLASRIEKLANADGEGLTSQAVDLLGLMRETATTYREAAV